MFTPTVKYYRGASNYTLANVSGISFSWGKQNIIDDYSGLSFTIAGFNPQWTVKPEVGDQVLVDGGVGIMSISGYISDVTITYGQTASMDSFVIQCEGPFIKHGRVYGSITTTAGTTTYTMAQSIQALSSGFYAQSGGYGSTTSAQTLTATAADLAHLWSRTEGGYIREQDLEAVMNGRNSMSSTTPYTFTDIPGDGKDKYNEIVFRSAADNYSSKVIVQADGFADQTAGTGAYPIQISTISSGTAEAANLAGYYFTQLDLNQQVPFAITWSSPISVTGPIMSSPYATNRPVTITFRGATYTCVIIGGDFTMSNSEWRATAYLVSSLAQAFLVLDSTTLGVLDTNKLGF